MIEFRGVTKRFPDGTVAVDDLDLQVRDGGITVFVGPSGCGKTTSLRMVNRMIDPSGGTILVNGTDVMKTDAAELRRGIGYVIQQAGLFPHRTIVDNVATVPLLLGWDKKKARARATELMETVGLAPEMAGRYPGQLSGGRGAVFRVGGKLAQYDEPGVLLSRPADGFVDNFVGRDRGYRGLQFRSSATLPLGELRTARGGERTEQGWTLVLDPEGRVLVAVYSTGAIGRLLPDDVVGVVRYARSHADAAS